LLHTLLIGMQEMTFII